MFEILIPRYNEPEALVGRLLDSISMQVGIDISKDIRVRIADDGSDELLSGAFLRKYPFDIQYMALAHRGLSATRNALLDACEGEYFMCCDADDSFFNLLAIRGIFDNLKQAPFDVMISPFFEEYLLDDGTMGFHLRQNVQPFVHGKVFRLNYIRENGIRWCDRFPAGGDTVFLDPAIKLTEHAAYQSMPFYIWRWNPSSIVRSENGFIEKLPLRLDAHMETIDIYLKRGRRDLAVEIAARTLIGAYFTMARQDWRNYDRMDIREAAAEILRRCIRDYGDLYSESDPEFRETLLQGYVKNYLKRGLTLPTVSLEEWMSSFDDSREG